MFQGFLKQPALGPKTPAAGHTRTDRSRSGGNTDGGSPAARDGHREGGCEPEKHRSWDLRDGEAGGHREWEEDGGAPVEVGGGAGAQRRHGGSQLCLHQGRECQRQPCPRVLVPGRTLPSALIRSASSPEGAHYFISHVYV